MPNQLFARIIIAAIAATTLITSVSPAAAVSAGDWQAGRIIDDTVFNYGNDMSVAQIQAFLNSKVPTCDTQGTQTSEFGGGTRAQYGTSRGFPPPYVCLKDYYENQTTHENNLQGRAIPAGGVSAAQIIYNAAQTYSINPKVLIVTLQKESSGPLVTDTWPFYTQYRTPMGYACPDTAPCDSQYFGFSNQVTSAAYQFRRYANFPNNYRHKAGQNNDVRFSPSTSCGSSTVFIKNQATASLYNYTPYQPNPAALANMTDSTAGGTAPCGAYGNRNFFWYYNKWFGSTRRDLVRASTGGVYVIEDGKKRAFPSEVIFLSHGYKWSDTLLISAAELASYPDGTAVEYNVHFRDSRLITSPGGGVYAIENGQKRAFPSEINFLSHGYTWSNVMSVTPGEIPLIPDGTAVEYNIRFREGRLITAPGQGVFLVANGLKQPLTSELAFVSYGYKWSYVVPVRAAELPLIPDGAAMGYNVHFRDGRLITYPGGGIYLVENGTKRPFPNQATFFSYGYQWSDAWVLSSIETNLIPDGAAMTPKS